MLELLRSNDLVHLSWAQAVLSGEGIDSVVLDQNESGVLGSIDTVPRRLMVPADQLERARAALERAERDGPRA